LINIRDALRSSKMRLLLMQLKGNTGNSINAYTTGIDKSNEIIKEIEEEIN
jgi:hypothetical protein